MADSYRNTLNARPTEYGPLRLLGAVGQDVQRMVADFLHIFGSEGKA